jgi:TrpR-related protein YerC/YecD
MQTSGSSVWETPSTQHFVDVVTAIDDIRMMQNFLRDVMTEKEISEIGSRLEAARMLQQGRKYTEIVEQTKLSSRTVARISDWMQNGCGGYEAALNLFDTHHDHLLPTRAG